MSPDVNCSPHKSDFLRINSTTTVVLRAHTDEVWNIEWSHDGHYLASASKDKSAIIWRAGDWTPYFVLRDHPYPVACLAWSKDDSVLLTSAEHHIKLWNTETGVCIRSLDGHTETVTALSWLPDGSGFISGGLDRKILLWEADGKRRDSWGATAIRITDLVVTPDFTRLVTIGMEHPLSPSVVDTTQSRGVPANDVPSTSGGNPPLPIGSKSASRMIVFDLTTKGTELSIDVEGELTSVKVSQKSQYAIINHAPDEIHLWDLNAGRMARKYTGQRQGRHVIRSCFGGIDDSFVASGSEDGKAYIWHRDTGALLEVLSGHGEGSVNSIAWNPRNERMFASCSDDNTIRIWEAILAGTSVD